MGEILKSPRSLTNRDPASEAEDAKGKLEEEAEQRRLGRLIADARQAHQDLPDDKFDELVAEAANRYKPKTNPPRATRIDMTLVPTSLNVEESLRKRVSDLEVENTKLLEELAVRRVELSQALGEGEQGTTTEVYLTREQLKQLASLFHLALCEDEKNG